MTFNSLDALKEYISSKCGVAIKSAQEEVHGIIQKFVEQYYSEFTPSVYERTYQLYNSLVKTGVKQAGGSWVAEVYFDASRLNYSSKGLHGHPVSGGYMNPYNHVVTDDGVFRNPKGSGGATLSAAAHGSHGGYKGGTAIWDAPMKILDEEALNILKKALIEAGIPIK